MRIVELGITRIGVSALLLGSACFGTPRAGLADDTAEELRQLRAAIQKELADLKRREAKLHQEFLRLDQKSQLLDEQLRKLRAAGTTAPGTTPPMEATSPPATAPVRPTGTEVAQTAPPPPAANPQPE